MMLTITPAPVRKTVHVNATAQRAFDVFTVRMHDWTPPSHSLLAVPRTELHIEPRQGGRWYERGGDGSECDWGYVIAWEPPHRLVLAWQLDAQFRFNPDLVTEVETRFIVEGPNRTRVELEHRNLDRFGERAEAVRAALDSPEGWGTVAQIAALAEQAT
jgi:uncharacterized protein YndB with AHSA1/START domain